MVAYGTTSVRRAANRGEEVQVWKPRGLSGAGLNSPTRFVCTRRVTVSLDHSGFVVTSAKPSPVLGHLDAAGLERMHEIRARIHAFRDIVAERQSRRRTRRRPAVRDVDFTVDSGDLHQVSKLLRFSEIDIVSANEGVQNEIQIDVRGLMGTLFLKDLRERIHRGMSGNIWEGLSAGGKTYGYAPVLG
jgi:hypothetical protein